VNLRVGDWTFPNSWRLPEVRTAATWHSHSRVTAVALAAVLVLGLSALELRSSWLESHVLSAIARRATFVVKPGASQAQTRPGRGPYHQRLGFSELPEFVRRLEARGYRIDAQAWNSPVSLALRHLGIFPIYHEKDQTGWSS
jgi:hypothetical protein